MSELNVSGIRLLPTAILAQVANDLEMAKQHFKRGAEFYRSGKFEEALNEFLEAYRLSMKPDLQYNLALCYEKLLKIEEALTAYEFYLKAKPDAPDRQFVEGRITFLRTKIEEQKKLRAAPPPDKPQLPSAAPSSPKPIQPPLRPETAVVEEIKAGREMPFHIFMWTSLALSLVGITVGGIFLYKAEGQEGEYADLVGGLKREGEITGSPSDYRFSDARAREIYAHQLEDIKEEGKRNNSFAKIGFISGAVLAVGGGIFYWLDRQQTLNHFGSGQVRLKVEPQARGGSFSLGVNF